MLVDMNPQDDVNLFFGDHNPLGPLGDMTHDSGSLPSPIFTPDASQVTIDPFQPFSGHGLNTPGRPGTPVSDVHETDSWDKYLDDPHSKGHSIDASMAIESPQMTNNHHMEIESPPITEQQVYDPQVPRWDITANMTPNANVVQVPQTTHNEPTNAPTQTQPKKRPPPPPSEADLPRAPYFNPNEKKDCGVLLQFTQVLLKQVNTLSEENAKLTKEKDGFAKELACSRDSEATLRGLLQRFMAKSSSPMIEEKPSKKVKVSHEQGEQKSYQKLVDHIAKSIRIAPTDKKEDVVNCVKLVEAVLPRMPNVAANILSDQKVHKCRCIGGSHYHCIAAFDDQPSNFKSVEIIVTLRPPSSPTETRTSMRHAILSEVCSLVNISPDRLKASTEAPGDLKETGVFSMTFLETLPSAVGLGSEKECSAREAFLRLHKVLRDPKSLSTSLKFVKSMRAVDNPVRGCLFYTIHDMKRKKKKIMVVEYLVVTLERQKQKIGTRMMEELKRVAKQENVDTIVVYSDKDATGWYRKQEFVPHTPEQSRPWWSHMGDFNFYTHIDFMSYKC